MTELNSTHLELRSRPLTRSEIKKEMKRRKGFTFASYSRLIKRTKSTSTRLADGEIGGELRERFLRFFGFTEEEVPLKKDREQGKAA